MKNTEIIREKSSQTPLSRFIRFYLVLLLLFVAFVSGLIIGGINKEKEFINAANIGKVYNQQVKPDFLSKDADFQRFWETWDIIKTYYVRQPVNETELLYGAMAGSVASLGDPHSVFFDPQTTKEFSDELKGTFEGIGAEIAIKNQRLTVVAALADTPAEKAGLRSGDKIFLIDGEDTASMSLDYAVSKIRGPEGSEVVLTIGRDGISETKEITLTRSKIKVVSVEWKMLDNNIADLKIHSFNEDTAEAFNKAVWEIIAQNPKGIILDLRNNPGGFLDTAILVSSEWIEDGVVVYERGSDGNLKKHKAQGKARLKDFKTIVLINQGSASASEIVAGALKDYGLANLIGEKTFGKGTVQSLFDLEDGSSIKLTIAEWLTPNQNTIDKDGIEPDIKVELTEDDFNNDKDPQLDRALEYFKTGQ